jgi:hypothetical protein
VRRVIALTIVAGTAAVLSLGQASADPLRSTSTSLSCPAEVAVLSFEQSPTCTAQVADTGTGLATTPTGVVELYAPNDHGVAVRAACTLSAGSCAVTFRGWSTPGVRTVTARYAGDSSHASSSGTQDVFVFVPPRPPPRSALRTLVPNVKGKSLAAAKAALRRYRCDVGAIDRGFNKRLQKGRVISERPGHGKLVPWGTKVDLVVSKGKR